MLRPAVFCWLLILLLFDPPDVAADTHISIVLTPRGYKNPRTMDNFTCGVDPSVDARRHLAEQNAIYIFETFLDNKETDPKYKTQVFDVVTFSKDGMAENMLHNRQDMEDPGLYTLFLSPPKAQCNTRTLEDAAEGAGEGYYPVYVGVSGNFMEIIKKFKRTSDTFTNFYNGVIPKLCGTKEKMRNETAYSRKQTITGMFNVLYNAEKERSLDPLHVKSCWSSDETINAIVKADMFELSPDAKFASTNFSAYESDGFVRARIERDTTERQALVLVNTEFAVAGGGVKPAGPDDIVEFDGPVMFQQGMNFIDMFVRIKVDSEEEDQEAFNLKLQDVSAMNKRVKRGAPGPGPAGGNGGKGKGAQAQAGGKGKGGKGKGAQAPAGGKGKGGKGKGAQVQAPAGGKGGKGGQAPAQGIILPPQPPTAAAQPRIPPIAIGGVGVPLARWWVTVGNGRWQVYHARSLGDQIDEFLRESNTRSHAYTNHGNPANQRPVCRRPNTNILRDDPCDISTGFNTPTDLRDSVVRAMQYAPIQAQLAAWRPDDPPLRLNFYDHNVVTTCHPGYLMDIAPLQDPVTADMYVAIVFKRDKKGNPFIITAFPDPNYTPP